MLISSQFSPKMQTFALGKKVAINDFKVGFMVLNTDNGILINEFSDKKFFKDMVCEFFIENNNLYALDRSGRVYKLND